MLSNSNQSYKKTQWQQYPDSTIDFPVAASTPLQLKAIPAAITAQEFTRLADWLSLFFPDENEAIYLRVFQGKGLQQKFAKSLAPVTRRKLANKASLQNYLRNLNRTNGVYWVVNCGGHADKDITRINACFVEWDDKPITGQHKLLDHAPLATSARVQTRHSVHAYWLLEDGPTDLADWYEAQARLTSYFQSDPRINTLSRLMRVPYFNHIAAGLEPKKVLPVQLAPERRYTIADILGAFPAVAKPVPAAMQTPRTAPACRDADTWSGRYRALKEFMQDHARFNKKANRFFMRCPVHGGNGDSSLFFLADSGAIACSTCGTNLDQVMQTLNLPFFNSFTEQFYYERDGVR